MIAWNVYDGEPFAHQRAIAVDGDTNFCQENPLAGAPCWRPAAPCSPATAATPR